VLSQYSRLLVIINYHGFGAQTVAAIGGGVYGLAIDTGTSVGRVTVTASIANEDRVDDGVTSMIHELGHQLGHLAHCGDCSKYLIYPVAGPAECLNIGWDIVGFSYSVAHETAHSKVSRGYIDPSSTITLDVLGGPFSQSYTLAPLELPPGNTPNVLRLSIGDPSWPEYLGYYAECRVKVNGDEGVSTLTDTLGLNREGLLVTSVHEFSTTDLIYPHRRATWCGPSISPVASTRSRRARCLPIPRSASPSAATVSSATARTARGRSASPTMRRCR
jgi:hypothetical protein